VAWDDSVFKLLVPAATIPATSAEGGNLLAAPVLPLRFIGMSIPGIDGGGAAGCCTIGGGTTCVGPNGCAPVEKEGVAVAIDGIFGGGCTGGGGARPPRALSWPGLMFMAPPPGLKSSIKEDPDDCDVKNGPLGLASCDEPLLTRLGGLEGTDETTGGTTAGLLAGASRPCERPEPNPCPVAPPISGG